MNKKLSLALILFALGFLGILSTLTMELSLPQETLQLLSAQFSPMQLRLVLLLNPTILLVLAVWAGTLLHRKVGLEVPLIWGWLQGGRPPAGSLLKFGLAGGLLAGVLILISSRLFAMAIPAEVALLQQMDQPLLVRFLYGGITEEILMRYGLMTLVVWLANKISGSLKPTVYWTGILLAALLFALGHFPVVFQTVPHPSSLLLAYIIIGNTLGGIIFGWLYWKKGLEAAFVAHIFAHVAMVSLG